MKKDTSALWYKDGHEIKADENLGFTEGVLKLEIAQVENMRKETCMKTCDIFCVFMCISVLYICH